jgi:hypothetical protein
MSAMRTAEGLTTKGATGAKERPILFSGPMVRAIREDRKTQTRRWCADSKIREGLEVYHMDEFRLSGDGFLQGRKSGEDWVNMVHGQGKNGRGIETRSPYGDAGDRLWVREVKAYDPSPSKVTWNSARIRTKSRRDLTKWRPSIFMPRWASRITLEVTGVRVERLQEIEVDDVAREGLQATDFMPTLKWPPMDGYIHADDHEAVRSGFRALWESINGAGSWDANPWVWVIEFKRLAAVADPV